MAGNKANTKPLTNTDTGLCPSRTDRSTGHRLRAGGETRCVSSSRPNGRSRRCQETPAGAIAPATASGRDQDGPGAKAPGQRPPRHRRALRPRRVGRWPLLLPDLPVWVALSSAGGGNAVRFLFPPGRAFSRIPGRSGRGHRPCPSAEPGSGPTGGPQSPASARPAPAGAGLPLRGWRRPLWHLPAGAGKRASLPAQRANPFPRIGKSFPAGKRPDFCFDTRPGP